MEIPELLNILAPRPFFEFAKDLMGENITIDVLERLLSLEKQRGFRWAIGMRPRKAWLVRLHRRRAALKRIREYGEKPMKDWGITPAMRQEWLAREAIEKELLNTFIERHCQGRQRKKVDKSCP